MNNLALRAISGAMYVVLIVCSLLFNNLYFCILCVLFGMLAMVEFSNMSAAIIDKPASDKPQAQNSCDTTGSTPMPTLALDVYGIIVLLLPCIGMSLYQNLNGLIVFGAMGAIMWLLYILLRFYMSLYQTDGKAVQRLAYSLLGQLYLGCGLICAQYLSVQSAGLVLLIFILIWINDTGAFLVGSAIGKRKLFPRLSPKKSWEGFFGGLFLGITVSIIFLATGVTADLIYYPIFGSWEAAFALPIVVGISGTLGDLFESMIKRTAGVKDSGNIIPGHGGILDRIDSMLFAMPATLMLIVVCEIIN